MASIKLYFDKRVNRKDGKFPLKINVTHKRQQALINLGVLLSPDQWDSTKGKVINGPNKSFLNGYISQRVHCAETELLNLIIRKYGRTCRRYTFEVITKESVTIHHGEFNHDYQSFYVKVN